MAKFKRLDAKSYTKLKRLTELLSVKEVMRATNRSYSTVRNVKNSENFEDYKASIKPVKTDDKPLTIAEATDRQLLEAIMERVNSMHLYVQDLRADQKVLEEYNGR
jgi:hypothetical protein